MMKRSKIPLASERAMLDLEAGIMVEDRADYDFDQLFEDLEDESVSVTFTNTTK